MFIHREMAGKISLSLQWEHDLALKKKEVAVGVDVDKPPGDTAYLKINDRVYVYK